MKHVIIVHGFKGKPDTNWKPWLKAELEELGIQVVVPEMPNTMAPTADEWQNKLDQCIGSPTKDIFLIGHSLGCITILRYLEKLDKDQKIGGCIFVAGFGTRFPEYNGGHDTFFDHDLDWSKIKQHCNNFVAIHSDDDRNVGLDQLELFKEELNAKAILMQDMGHFGSNDGVYEIPIVKSEIVNLIQ